MRLIIAKWLTFLKPLRRSNDGRTNNRFRINFHYSKKNGQDLVEFALVLPLLLLIIVGVLDLGRAFFASIAVANVTREGARYGMDIDWDDNCQNGCDYSEVYNAAFGEASNTGLDLTNLTVVANCGNCESDDNLIVTGIFDFELILNLILTDFSIQRSTTMRIP